MIGKIIGAYAGGKAAQHTSKIAGPTGAALGVLAPLVLRRLSIPAMVVLAAGGYAAKKLFDKAEADRKANEGAPRPDAKPAAV